MNLFQASVQIVINQSIILAQANCQDPRVCIQVYCVDIILPVCDGWASEAHRTTNRYILGGGLQLEIWPASKQKQKLAGARRSLRARSEERLGR